MEQLNITLAKYCIPVDLDESNYIFAIIDGKASTIPLDPANRHYAEILRQVEAGTLVIQEAE